MRDPQEENTIKFVFDGKEILIGAELASDSFNEVLARYNAGESGRLLNGNPSGTPVGLLDPADFPPRK